MTFIQWIYSSYPNPSISGQWGMLHIGVLVLSIAITVALSILFRGKSSNDSKEKARKIVIWTLVGLIFTFELLRRIINLCKTTDYSLNNMLYILLPRPWCAISCWLLIASVFVRKKFFYNLASMSALLCAIIFFAYPSAGVNNQYILFENLYSISTHALLLITSICLITLRFTDFRYKTIWKELYGLAIIYAYGILEINVLDISTDPLYFMEGNEVQEILGLPYGMFIGVYIIFMIIYINVFYLINDRKNVFVRRKKKIKQKAVV